MMQQGVCVLIVRPNAPELDNFYGGNAQTLQGEMAPITRRTASRAVVLYGRLYGGFRELRTVIRRDMHDMEVFPQNSRRDKDKPSLSLFDSQTITGIHHVICVTLACLLP